MRISILLLVRFAILLLIGVAASPLIFQLKAQERPRIFITPNFTRRTEGYGSPYSKERITTIEDRTIEVSRDFSESCKEVTVSAERKKADYIVRLNWQIGRSRIAVYKQNGDLVGVTQKSSVSGAVKAACELIKSLSQTGSGGQKEQPETRAQPESNSDPAVSTR